MQRDYLYFLFQKYFDRNLTDLEWLELDGYLQNSDQAEVEKVFLLFMEEHVAWDKKNHHVSELSQIKIDQILNAEKINRKAYNRQFYPKQNIVKIILAISAVLIWVFGASIFFQPRDINQSIPAIKMLTDFNPGHDGASLKFDNGEVLNLENYKNGPQKIQLANGISILVDHKSARYILSTTSTNTPQVYNTIETPKGRKYHVKLSDGSEIWLNAGSSLSFPLVFQGENREVILKGEGYFEIAKNPKRPFQVTIKGSDTKIEVLGTHFNISSYPEDNGFSTTLLEGAIRVFNKKYTEVLKPGQTAIVDWDNNVKLSSSGVPEESVAWKNNFFSFENADLETVMIELARWYNIEVSYSGEKSESRFSGKIDKNLRFSEVLEILGGTDIKYKIESDHKIQIITNK